MHIYRVEELIWGILFVVFGGMQTLIWFSPRLQEHGRQSRGSLAGRLPFLMLGLMQVSESFDPRHRVSDRTLIIGGTCLAVLVLLSLWGIIRRRREKATPED